eukprot:scaffold7328_cov314-Pinguiococcus_pyrenoidosus.AAC.25
MTALSLGRMKNSTNRELGDWTLCAKRCQGAPDGCIGFSFLRMCFVPAVLAHAPFDALDLQVVHQLLTEVVAQLVGAYTDGSIA